MYTNIDVWCMLVRRPIKGQAATAQVLYADHCSTICIMTCFLHAQMLKDRPQPHFVVCCVQGPQIVTVPKFDVPARYWIVPFLDAYLNYYGAIGSDFNSTPGQYLVVGRSEGRACTPQAHCSLRHEL